MTPELLAAASFALGATTGVAACFTVLEWAIGRVERRHQKRSPSR